MATKLIKIICAGIAFSLVIIGDVASVSIFGLIEHGWPFAFYVRELHTVETRFPWASAQCWAILSGKPISFDFSMLLIDCAIAMVALFLLFAIWNRISPKRHRQHKVQCDNKRKTYQFSIGRLFLALTFFGCSIGITLNTFNHDQKSEAMIKHCQTYRDEITLLDFQASSIHSRFCRRVFGYHVNEFGFKRPQLANIHRAKLERLNEFIQISQKLDSIKTIRLMPRFEFAPSHLSAMARLESIETIIIVEWNSTKHELVSNRFPGTQVLNFEVYFEELKREEMRLLRKRAYGG